MYPSLCKFVCIINNNMRLITMLLGSRKLVHNTSWLVVDTPTVCPKSVHNRCRCRKTFLFLFCFFFLLLFSSFFFFLTATCVSRSLPYASIYLDDILHVYSPRWDEQMLEISIGLGVGTRRGDKFLLCFIIGKPLYTVRKDKNFT